jgi:hypothetical protein
MKIQTRLARFVWFIAVPAMLAGAALDAFPQGAVKEAASGKDGRPASTYDIEIKDGVLLWTGAKRKDHASEVPATINNVVDLLRELYPDANFVVAPALGDHVLAELKLRSSSVVGALEAIRVASESSLQWRIMTPSSVIDPSTGLPKAPASEIGRTLYVLDAEQVSTPKQPNLKVEAFNVSIYLDNAGPAEERDKRILQIEQMVHDSMKLYTELVARASNSSKAKTLPTPSIQFHRGANLVIVIGDPEGVAVAAKVIGALPGARRSAASDPGNASESLQQIEDRIKQLQRDGVPNSRR